MKRILSPPFPLAIGLAMSFLSTAVLGETEATAQERRWPHWPSGEFFPLAVWLQNPSNAARYQKAGFNTFVALWKGPTDEQLSAVKRAGMYVICEQGPAALQHLDDPTIIGWMHGDE